ncbi:MAG: CapA family protein [Clostridia bacterium]|nr:CapA family protein [Clostridia bacterium]
MRNRIYKIIIITLLLFSLCACSFKAEPVHIPVATVTDAGFDYSSAASKISAASGLNITSEFLENMGENTAYQLVSSVDSGTYTEKTWLSLTGYSYYVIKDMLSGAINADNIKDCGNNGKGSFSVAFVGDILFDKDFRPMVHANEMGGMLNCIDKSVVDYLNACDVFLINNEFTIGERGEPLSGKTWTFQVEPDKIQLLKDLGADIVSLANNHIYDYGEVGFFDTIDNLKKAGMPYIGAGNNIDEASKPCYFIVNGIKVGIVAASCAEKTTSFNPVATADSHGVMGTYDSAAFVDAIKKADAECDILVAYVHWGTENTTVLDEQQKTLAREYIDAGVDAVIGGHTHCLQGMEFYKDVPIVYSVGNFWFNSKTLDSCVITLEIDSNADMGIRIMPLKQQNCETRLLFGEDSRALFDRVESYEPQGVSIADDGLITKANP